MPPASHGRYTVVRKIADGGMAEIFLGRQHGAEGFERPVVLKRILTPFVADPQFRNMLIDEGHVAMSLNHSNIAQVLDLGVADGRYFLVLELVDGWDLNTVIHRARDARVPFPEEIALYVTAEVCRALHYAHSKKKGDRALGIVHRDVSPHNVLVSEQGEVKLTDFGIAKAMGKRERTGTGVIKGKLAFMSPEQASGAVLDRRSDLFSVGTMLYVMLVGKKPFEAPTDLESMLRIQRADFPPPEIACPELAAPAAAVIKKAMRLLPSERYQTAEEMLVDVERVQRSAYRPAGQTELKAWLAGLGAKDGVLPLLRQVPGKPAAPGGELDGADLILDDSAGAGAALGETVALETPPPVTRTPSPVPGVAAGAERTSSATRLDRPSTASDAGPGREVRGSPARTAFTVVLAAAALGAVALAIFGPGQPPPPPGVAKVARTRPAPQGPAVIPVDSVLAPAPVRDGGADSVEDATGARADALAAGDARAAELPSAGGVAEAGASAADDVDEEALQRRAEPESPGRVIGGDSDGPGEIAARAPVHPTVSVKVKSVPDGAFVVVRHAARERVLGRTPIALRFRAGTTYELEFRKKGYVSATTKVKVTAKTRPVFIVMKKKPKPKPEKKGFFDGIFGNATERKR